MRHRNISSWDTEEDSEDGNEIMMTNGENPVLYIVPYNWYFLGLSLSQCDWISFSLYLYSLFLWLFYCTPLSGVTSLE